MQTTTVANGKSIYEVGLNELHTVSNDETLHKKVDNDFREARGREGARLHVTLQAISETDRRQTENTIATLNSIANLTAELQEKTAQLTHLIQSFEATADKRFTGVHDDLRARAEALTNQVSGFWQAENEHFNTIRNQVGQFENAISTQSRESTERLAVDVRKLRDEVVSLIDSRMNQSDAAFAAVRGDVEVVKFLVMDLIKDRIGRTDPKQKPF